jgi:hypothetical protein
MLGVNFQWDAVESEFGEQTIHLISMLSAFRKRRKELLACLLDDDGFVSMILADGINALVAVVYM